MIDDIQLIQLDEFQRICTIFATNGGPMTIENFPLGRLSKFLLILGYLIHVTRPSYKKIIYQYSWNYVLKRHKLPDIIGVYPVTISIESQAKMERFYLKKEIKYKIEIIDEDQEAIDSLGTDSEWTLGTWVIK